MPGIFCLTDSLSRKAFELDTLRPYQHMAVDTLIRLAPAKQFLLLQAATGAGKTVMASHIMQYYAEKWNFRCLFLAHKAILVRQALKRMQASFADADFNVDCLCASVQKPGVARERIIVASPQTLARRLDDLPRIDVVLIDECHRVPPKGQKSLYADVIEAVIAARPNARIIGITATPWRLGQPCIYGPSLRAGQECWWDSLDVHISIAELQAQGWLAPLTALSCAPEEDLLHLPVGASGDFREDALESTLLKPLHLGSAVKAVQQYAAGRAHIAVFCVTIAHARTLADRFAAADIPAAAIDSKAGHEANQEVLAAFARGNLRVLCSVGMLTEGWDCPQTDCLVLCRPTLSPALYVQMVGRGLRISEGKKDCLLLDLSGNILRHGSPNAPRIRLGANLALEAFGQGAGDTEEVPERRCPFCDALLFDTAGLNCPQCQAPFFEFEEQGRQFQRINLARLEHYMRRGDEVRRLREEAEALERAREKARQEEQAKRKAAHRASLINQGEPTKARVCSHTKPEVYQIRNGPAAGAVALKFDILVEVPGCGRRNVQVILDPEGAMGRKSRTAYWALQDSRDFWKVCGQGTFPASRAGLVARWATVRLPEELLIKQTMGGWIRVLWKEPQQKTARKKTAQSARETA